jgi:hypothetical protein
MATLVSPGVSVSVTDESFYAPAGTGSVPLIIIATAQDKSTPDGSGTAAYTTAATAGKIQLITSQRDLLTNYGNPIFKTSGGTPLHGHELNEYGLMAAYSFLGIANRAYVMRANVDLDQLTARASAPSAAAANGAYWLDTAITVWGLKRWSGSAWVRQTVKVPASSDMDTPSSLKPAYGKDGEFAAVYFENDGDTAGSVKLHHKLSGVWYVIGSAGWDSASGRDFQLASYTSLPSTKSGGGSLAEGDLILQIDSPNNGTSIAVKVYNASSGQWASESIDQHVNSATVFAAYGSNLSEGDLWADFIADDATIILRRHNGNSDLTVTSSAALSDTAIDLTGHSGKVAFSITVNEGTAVDVELSSDGDSDGNASVDDIVADINSALSLANATVSFTSTVLASNVSGKIRIVDTAGRDILLEAGNVSGFGPANLSLTADSVYTNWEVLSYEASATAVVGDTANGTLWYDNVISADNIDILVNDSSNGWETYSGDIQVSASEPSKQSDGTSALETGDLWIDGGDLENFPVIYKWSAGDAWVLVDNTDQVTGDGIVFADFRPRATTLSSVMDADSPAESSYPIGILGWNKRASGGNVKEYRDVYVVSGNDIGPKWVDYSGNKPDGSPYMLRKAQRQAVVRQMQAAVAASEDARNETNRFNLLAAPGYPELLDEMISLNVDRKETAFIIADAPLRLAASASATQAWANNSNNADVNGEDGLVSSSAYVGVYYPHALTTNLDGTNVLQPASHIALRTLAFNDQVAFPWFAPAGFQRGLVSNATSVGYLDAAQAEYVPVALSEGQRDSLYVNKINPIGNFPGRGLAVFGQKTLNPVASALDRVNVARLVVYIRERLDDIMKPFLFEPNDEITRQNAKVVVDRFLGQLVTQRGLFDFLTVCDTTNNTPARIDRNELHIDVAIQPVKAVEFIYIPVRIQNTLGQSQ